MLIIQTNISLNPNAKQPIDFQSRMYYIKKQTWDEFKEYIKSNEPFTSKLVSGTMYGMTKPEGCTIENIIVDDEFHLEVVMTYGKDIYCNAKYYKVEDKDFERLKTEYEHKGFYY